ncbi:hypothetical protein BGZ74_003835 [Mortierella antarctica]|nr:hypothetical protein BGZ74_003835 [Mortierella antarctica]
MKFLTVALTCIVAAASADIVTRHLPFIKTLSKPYNYKDYQQPYTYHGVSRCEFPEGTQPNLKELQKIAGSRWECRAFNGTRFNHCTVKPEIRDLTSVEFVQVTTTLCAKYNDGLLMIQQGPPASAQQ